jgi:hypothetical protein
LLPIRAQWQFSSRVKEIFSNKSVPPNPKVSFSALIMGVPQLFVSFPAYHKGIFTVLQAFLSQLPI